MSRRMMKFGWFSLKHEYGWLGIIFRLWNPKWFFEQGFKFAEEYFKEKDDIIIKEQEEDAQKLPE